MRTLTWKHRLERLRLLIDEENPFFLMISPTAPHVQNLYDPPAPPARYYGLFNDTTVPRTPNFNPPQKYQKGKPSWLRDLAPLNSTQIDEIDLLYQRRLESLRGVDDIVDDVVEMLEKKGIIDNTYSKPSGGSSMVSTYSILLLTTRSNILY
jgi:arylsulfatase A-like enzyme